jgi:hypothetical protein
MWTFIELDTCSEQYKLLTSCAKLSLSQGQFNWSTLECFQIGDAQLHV